MVRWKVSRSIKLSLVSLLKFFKLLFGEVEVVEQFGRLFGNIGLFEWVLYGLDPLNKLIILYEQKFILLSKVDCFRIFNYLIL